MTDIFLGDVEVEDVLERVLETVDRESVDILYVDSAM